MYVRPEYIESKSISVEHSIHVAYCMVADGGIKQKAFKTQVKVPVPNFHPKSWVFLIHSSSLSHIHYTTAKNVTYT